MVTTHSEDEWRLLRSLRNQGRADSGGWLEHARLGFNYRIDDIRAAIGLGQLEKLDEILARRAAVAAPLHGALGGIEGLELPVPGRRRARAVVVRLRRRASRGNRPRSGDRALDARGVQTARYLPCIHLQSYMQERYGFRAGLCPVAEDASSRTLALPFHALLDEDDQAHVADALRAALGELMPRPGQGEALAAWALSGHGDACSARHLQPAWHH